MLTYVNSSTSSAKYICRWPALALVQVMACSAPSHYLNQWRVLPIGLVGTNFSEIQIWILSFSFKKIHLKLSSAKMVAILSRGRWVNWTQRTNPQTASKTFHSTKCIWKKSSKKCHLFFRALDVFKSCMIGLISDRIYTWVSKWYLLFRHVNGSCIFTFTWHYP